MKPLSVLSFGAVLALGLAAQSFAGTNGSFDAELLSIQHEWAAANYEVKDKKLRRDAFLALIDRCAAFSSANPERAEAQAWEGIVLSTYAGVASAMSAMKFAKAAREALQRAESIDANVLGGGVYASLGALYSKVPGGLMGFGDDDLARRYFEKALAVDPSNIDSNYFYGEFLLDQDNAAEALVVLQRALNAPADSARPVFDAGRRGEIRALLAIAEREAS